MRSIRSRGDTIRAWTIQSEAAWQAFQGRRVLRADGRRVFRHFRPAYAWLMAQMKRRLAGSTGRYPIWFWHLPKPDLRRRAILPRGERGVRIELELPRERVLLFDFETWHCVLNRWGLSLSLRESRDWDRKIKGFDQHQALLPPPLEAELQASWERVFDLDRPRR